jgi:hypothetical protein
VSVFPARAGVSPRARCSLAWSWRLPRSCGGVSYGAKFGFTPKESSSHAGVSLTPTTTLPTPGCPPRTRGGVAMVVRALRNPKGSSPQVRGCFDDVDPVTPLRGVFLARAGVSPTASSSSPDFRCLPRTLGGISNALGIGNHGRRPSPHARGCLRRERSRRAVHDLFLASARVAPTCRQQTSWRSRPLRMRGGVARLTFAEVVDDTVLSAWAEVCHTTGSDCGCSTAVLCMRGGVSFGQPFRFMA